MPENVGLELPTGTILGLHIVLFIALTGLAALPINMRGRLIVLLLGLILALLLLLAGIGFGIYYLVRWLF